jgi:uncharacterized protein Smg (DUF494 family)
MYNRRKFLRFFNQRLRYTRHLIHGKMLDYLYKKISKRLPKTPTRLPISHHSSMRIYTDTECIKLNPECRGFLLFLEQHKVLSPKHREAIINKIMSLETREIDVLDLKNIVANFLLPQTIQKYNAFIKQTIYYNQHERTH